MNSSSPEDVPAWQNVAAHPAWAPYRSLLDRLPRKRFPDHDDLQALLPPGVTGAGGHPLRFLPADALPDRGGEGAYEREIAATGRVSTRPGDLHDLCNALVWARYPRLKRALNRRHLAALPESRPGRRGPVRDALTLFDECGLVLVCPDREPLETLARHDWRGLFGQAGEAWPRSLRAWMVGHANLEKLWSPYKAMTAHCLLLHAPDGLHDAEAVDRAAAACWWPRQGITGPGSLCPLPFTGIPGWWLAPQDAAFYDDPSVFRPPRADRSQPPVLSAPA